MINHILLYIALLAGCIPLILFKIKGCEIKKHNGVFALLCLLAFSSVYEGIVSICLRVNITAWYWIYSLLEFTAIWYTFKTLIVQRPKWFFITFLGLFLLLYCYSFIYLVDFPVFIFKAINKGFVTIFVLLSSFLWVKQVFEQKVILRLYQESSFYIVMGLFFYYSTTISLFMLSNYIYHHDADFNVYWLVNIISSLILRIILSISVWKMN